jgi:prepilin-type N-terminal cleavage/methylation domain-containing protein
MHFFRLLPQRRRGFTFIEVMFAVLVMGAGVAMIATMLPVAARQVRDLREQAAGAALIESGFHLVESQAIQDSRSAGPIYGGVLADQTFPDIADDRVFTYPTIENLFSPTTPNLNNGIRADDPSVVGINFTTEYQFGVPAFDATLFNRVQIEAGTTVEVNGITTPGGRYAWIPFYQRAAITAPDPGSPYPIPAAMVAIAARNVPAISTSHFAVVDNPGSATDAEVHLWNNPLPIIVNTLEGDKLIDTTANTTDEFVTNGLIVADEPDKIFIEFPPGSLPDYQAAIRQAVVEGAVVILWSDQLANSWLPDTPGTITSPPPPFGNETPFSTAPIPGYAQEGPEQMRIYKLGKRLEDTADGIFFELDPSTQLDNQIDVVDEKWEREDVRGVSGYLVGRMLRDPTRPWNETTNPFVGPSQVISTLAGPEVNFFIREP